MAINNRAKDLALGIAAALDAGDDITPVKMAIVEWLADADAYTRAERLVSYVNANAVLIALLMDAAPRWYEAGFMLGGAYANAGKDVVFPEAPTSATLFQDLAQAFENEPEPDA